MPKEPFDPIRFACYIIAGVLAVQAFAIVVGLIMCATHAEIIISDPNIVCDPKDRLSALLNAMLAAALALLGHFKGGPPPPPPPEK
jgi:hypothetical protein